MANPLEALFHYSVKEGLSELAEEIDDVLSNIAFAGFANDLGYINSEKERLKKKYEHLVEIRPSFLEYDLDATLLGIGSVKMAYISFVQNPWEEMTPPEREEDAEDILAENHFLGGEVSIPITVAVNNLEKKGAEIHGWSLWSDGDFGVDYTFPEA